MDFIQQTVLNAQKEGDLVCEAINEHEEAIERLETKLESINAVLAALDEEPYVLLPRLRPLRPPTTPSDSQPPPEPGDSTSDKTTTIVSDPSPATDAPPTEPAAHARSGLGSRGKLGDENVRDAIMSFDGWFSMGELAEIMNSSGEGVRRYVKKFEAKGMLEKQGEFGRTKYRYVKPKDPGPGNPPPPKEARPTDMAVRGAPVAGTGHNRSGGKGWTRSKDINKLLEEVERQGGLIQKRPNNHIRVINPKGKAGENVVGISQSPSEQGVFHLVKQDLQKAGFRL